MPERLKSYFTVEEATAATDTSAERRRGGAPICVFAGDHLSDRCLLGRRIRDISATGARAEADVELAIGQTLHITTDEHTYDMGSVKWTLDRQFGIDLCDAAEVLGEHQPDIDPGT